jgi:hypothetical protein
VVANAPPDSRLVPAGDRAYLVAGGILFHLDEKGRDQDPAHHRGFPTNTLSAGNGFDLASTAPLPSRVRNQPYVMKQVADRGGLLHDGRPIAGLSTGHLFVVGVEGDSSSKVVLVANPGGGRAPAGASPHKVRDESLRIDDKAFYCPVVESPTIRSVLRTLARPRPLEMSRAPAIAVPAGGSVEQQADGARPVQQHDERSRTVARAANSDPKARDDADRQLGLRGKDDE